MAWTTLYRQSIEKMKPEQKDIFSMKWVNLAEPVPILEAWGQFPDESTLSSQLEEGVEQTNLRKLPLCRLIVKNPIDGIWLMGRTCCRGLEMGDDDSSLSTPLFVTP